MREELVRMEEEGRETIRTGAIHFWITSATEPSSGLGTSPSNAACIPALTPPHPVWPKKLTYHHQSLRSLRREREGEEGRGGTYHKRWLLQLWVRELRMRVRRKPRDLLGENIGQCFAGLRYDRERVRRGFQVRESRRSGGAYVDEDWTGCDTGRTRGVWYEEKIAKMKKWKFKYSEDEEVWSFVSAYSILLIDRERERRV